jgi:hypothetical protein
MLQRIMGANSHSHGETIEGVRMNEAVTKLAFLGRRRRVYTRIVALSGAYPGDRILDVGCSGVTWFTSQTRSAGAQRCR